MRVLVNTSVLLKGGAIQAATAFVTQAEARGEGIEWYYAFSPVMWEELQRLGISIPESRCLVLEASPARKNKLRKRLAAYEKTLGADLVFTFFGPSYVRFRAIHLCGVADPFVTHPNPYAIAAQGGMITRLKSRLLSRYKGYWFRQAEAWVVEAEVARYGLSQRYGCDAAKIAVVPNTYGKHFPASGGETDHPQADRKVRLLTMTAYYPHKDLEIIPAVAEILKSRGYTNLEFQLTLPEGEPALQRILSDAVSRGVEKNLVNLGKVPVVRAPEIYQQSDISFLPTLLETFTANYPEAMLMGLPIVTTKFDFATNVCGDAALYFSPHSAESAADWIGGLLDDGNLWREQVVKGKERLRTLPSADQKFDLFVKVIRETVQSGSHQVH